MLEKQAKGPNLGLMGDLGFEGELGVWLALVGGGEEVGPGDPPAQGQGRLHQHLQGNQIGPTEEEEAEEGGEEEEEKSFGQSTRLIACAAGLVKLRQDVSDKQPDQDAQTDR